MQKVIIYKYNRTQRKKTRIFDSVSLYSNKNGRTSQIDRWKEIKQKCIKRYGSMSVGYCTSTLSGETTEKGSCDQMNTMSFPSNSKSQRADIQRHKMSLSLSLGPEDAHSDPGNLSSKYTVYSYIGTLDHYRAHLQAANTAPA